MQKIAHNMCEVRGVRTTKAIIIIFKDKSYYFYEAHGADANSCYAGFMTHEAHEPDAKSLVFFILYVFFIHDMSLGFVTNNSKLFCLQIFIMLDHLTSIIS